MNYQKLGNSDLLVSSIGFGGNALTDFFGPVLKKDALRALDAALDHGISFLDTSDAYGEGANEELIGSALAGRRNAVQLATKFGYVAFPGGLGVDASPGRVRPACEQSLRRLGMDEIDLYYLHRIDPKTPIEDTVGAMARLVEAGLVRALGLSEAAPDTLRRAHAVHPISALQSEYSLWARFAEKDILAVCRELGISFVAYAPLGRGFLAGGMENGQVLAENDRRRTMPRFESENLAGNLALLEPIIEIAGAKGVTPAQLALAWILAGEDAIVPIPGSSRRDHVAENAAAADISLNAEEKRRLDQTMGEDAIHGPRGSEALLSKVEVRG